LDIHEIPDDDGIRLAVTTLRPGVPQRGLVQQRPRQQPLCIRHIHPAEPGLAGARRGAADAMSAPDIRGIGPAVLYLQDGDDLHRGETSTPRVLWSAGTGVRDQTDELSGVTAPGEQIAVARQQSFGPNAATPWLFAVTQVGFRPAIDGRASASTNDLGQG
jgi:hypothetical protein